MVLALLRLLGGGGWRHTVALPLGTRRNSAGVGEGMPNPNPY
jgi:hypothetical protein